MLEAAKRRVETRDPRSDPRPGDILRAGQWLFSVTSTDVWVSTMMTNILTGLPGAHPEWSFDLVSWRSKMAKARVMAIGIKGDET